MEDNYGAVVGANHEALAQLLEQVNILWLLREDLANHSELLCIRETLWIWFGAWVFYTWKGHQGFPSLLKPSSEIRSLKAKTDHAGSSSRWDFGWNKLISLEVFMEQLSPFCGCKLQLDIANLGLIKLGIL